MFSHVFPCFPIFSSHVFPVLRVFPEAAALLVQSLDIEEPEIFRKRQGPSCVSLRGAVLRALVHRWDTVDARCSGRPWLHGRGSPEAAWLVNVTPVGSWVLGKGWNLYYPCTNRAKVFTTFEADAAG